MKIGVVADSHGDVQAAKKAGVIFQREGVQAVFHAGDIGSPMVLKELLRPLPPETPLYAVLGNMDPFPVSDPSASRPTSIRRRLAKIELNDQSIIVLHGDRERPLLDALESGVDYLFTGHTHRAHILQRGKTKWINPGALHRSPKPSVAVVDTETGAVAIIPLDSAEKTDPHSRFLSPPLE